MRTRTVIISTNVLLCQSIICVIFSPIISVECANFLGFSVSRRTKIKVFMTVFAVLGQPLQKSAAHCTNKWPFPASVIIWFIPQSWLTAGVSSLLIGLIQSSAPADWSKSKRWISWFVLIRDSGVLRRLNHSTRLIIPPPEPRKLVQSKAWLVESVVLNRIKAGGLCSTPQLFFIILASLGGATHSDRQKWSCQAIYQVICQKALHTEEYESPTRRIKVQHQSLNIIYVA